MVRYQRPKDALANIINKDRRGVRDVQRATGTEKVQAAALAVQASQDAAQAVELADGKLTVSPDAPAAGDGDGKPVGALWMRKDDSGAFVGYWEWSGSAWQDRPLSREIIPLITTAMLEADAIDGMTITGAIVRTAPSGERMQLDQYGLAAYDVNDERILTLSPGPSGLLLANAALSDLIGGLDNVSVAFTKQSENAWGRLDFEKLQIINSDVGKNHVATVSNDYLSLHHREGSGALPNYSHKHFSVQVDGNRTLMELGYRASGDSNGTIGHLRVFKDEVKGYTAELAVDEVVAAREVRIGSLGHLAATVNQLPSAATESAAGIVERATQAEVDAGTDTTRYVTPKTLRDRGSTGTLTLLRGVLHASRAQSLTEKDGMVTLIMHLENGNGLTLSASYQDIAIIPTGYRPPKEMFFPGVSPATTAATVNCHITAAGTLRVAVSGNVAAGIAVTYPI